MSQVNLNDYMIDNVSVRLIRERTVYTTDVNAIDASAPWKIANFMFAITEELTHEKFYVIHLNTKNTLQSINLVTTGTINSTLVTPREIFQAALLANAVSIVLVHNHPSGDCMPSSEDILVTKRIKEAGEMLGISVLDHIIVGEKCYCSMREQELI